MKAVRLMTEYLINPIGIDITKPRLFWNCDEGIKQTAYHIIAKTDDGKIIWDTGKTYSNSMWGEYTGDPLKSRDRVTWNVTLWDENDYSGEINDDSYFELGLLNASDWTAKWITGNYNPKRKKFYPIDCFLKNFEAVNIVKARLYVTACGIYEGRLNGQRIGDYILVPGITDYKKRIQYQTYDVLNLLQDGSNRLEFELADGWYRGSVGAWGLRNQYGKETKLLVQLELIDKNGDYTVINSDDKWQWSNDGPIRMADNKDGEVVDANLIPSYVNKAKETYHKIIPTASNNVSIKDQEVFKPVIISTPSGKTVFDFGQNIAGYISFKLNAKNGQIIKMRFGEMLDDTGEFTQKNIQCTGNILVGKDKVTPLQQIIYTCKEGENHYKTKFAIFGFQYILLETDVDFNSEDFTAIAVYSDIQETSEFKSSNELLNKFVECTVWSAKGNSCDIPTDCPTRERHGWTGDAQIFVGTANYLFNYMPFIKKFLHDIYDWQKRNGKLPQIAPAGGRDFYMAAMDGSVGWADAGVIIPYYLWKQYGDKSILKEYYDSMRKYARFMQRRCGKRQLLSYPLHINNEDRKFAVNKGQAFGEWAEPAEVHKMTWKDFSYSHPEEATAYTCYIMELMEEVALELNQQEDAVEYRKYTDGTRRAYQALMRTEAYSLDTNRQARLVRPLYFKLLDDEQEKYAKERLIKTLDDFNWKLGTGFLSTPFILDVLTDIDIEYAYRLLENEEMPGWLYMPKNGATTIWESWEGTKAQGNIASLNHYAKGAVCEWLFRVMCGVRIDRENHFIISPRPGGHFNHAKVTYNSIYGLVESGWIRENSTIMYEFIIPSNSTATVLLPDTQKFNVCSGVHTFKKVLK